MQMTDEDLAYDRLWRERFNVPLPMLGGGDVVRQILMNDGVSPRRIKDELSRVAGCRYASSSP